MKSKKSLSENKPQVKSKYRKSTYGEVFTAEREVKAMCDLIPDEMYSDITKTFLEPCVGEAVFLIEILKRKFAYCKNEKDGLKALSSVVGIDIQEDNVFISRQKLLDLYIDHFPQSNQFCRLMAKQILENNIMHGDSLEIMQSWVQETKPIQLSLF